MTAVDLAFPVKGEHVPCDHGYTLYGALSRAVSALHRAPWLQVHPLGGTPVDLDTLLLGQRAQLRLRLPVERIPDVLGLAGVTLDVAGSLLCLGAPSVHALLPAASLDARLVVIKLTNVPRRAAAGPDRAALDTDGCARRYEAELRRQLAALDIGAAAELRGRRSIAVAGRRIVGYSVRVAGLDAAQSIRLQEAGLGGKHAMGCGVFRETRGEPCRG